jgi:hypothetical protein
MTLLLLHELVLLVVDRVEPAKSSAAWNKVVAHVIVE